MSAPPLNEDAIDTLIRSCKINGKDMYKLSACEYLLQRDLSAFPVELELIVAALRVGVPKRLEQWPGGGKPEDYLEQLADQFAQSAHTDREAALFAVHAWAEAMDFAPEHNPAPLPNDGRIYEEPPDPREDRLARQIMAAIVSVGGFLGGAFGAGIVPILMLAVDIAYDLNVDRDGQQRQMNLIWFVLILMVVGGVLGGLAALAGWHYGRGDCYPWATFAVAFGSACSSILIVLFVPCIPLLLQPVVYFGMVFGATFRSAARGGRT